MRMKDLFTVPEGEKVTEKMFGRVLISSVCSILLSMACLFGTTWAWFEVSVENTENVIEIAAVEPEVQVSKDGSTVMPADDGSYTLSEGTYSIQIGLKQPDQPGTDTGILSDAKYPVYVIMTVTQENTIQYRVLKYETRESATSCVVTAKVGTGKEAVIRFSASWVRPADVEESYGEITI